MNVLGSFFAVDERSYVRVMEALEDRDLGGQVVFQLLIELAHVYRLDCYQSLHALRVLYCVSVRVLEQFGNNRTVCVALYTVAKLPRPISSCFLKLLPTFSSRGCCLRAPADKSVCLPRPW